MKKEVREKLRIDKNVLEEINDFLLSEDNPLINNLLKVVEKYGDVKEINRKAREASRLEYLLERLEKKNLDFLKKLENLIEKRDKGEFVSIPEYRRRILGERVDSISFDEAYAITLEISACNFFPWLVEEAEKAIKQQDLMPARYIRTRSMKEQVEDGDILAFTAAMQVIGASYVQTLDTKGTMPGPDGKPVNVHLGGCDTITGYFGGVGMPNDLALKWVDELLYYYTEYGVRQVLNINMGTVLLGYLLYKLGIDIEFKISVFMGHDNPYSCLWTFLMAKLLSRGGSTSLAGFNFSNSVNAETILAAADIRSRLGFEDRVRLEHHIVETYKGIVRQPYNRLEELLSIAGRVKNLSAKHEGAYPDIEEKREHPSDLLDYFLSKEEILEKGLMPKLLLNYLDKHDAVNRTARALTERGIAVVAARNLHKT